MYVISGVNQPMPDDDPYDNCGGTCLHIEYVILAEFLLS